MSADRHNPPQGTGDRLLGRRIGPYVLRRVIAAGGMGTVYEATQANPPRTVALKMMREGLLSPSARRRFEYEARILARLQHPGIAQVIDAGTFQESEDSEDGTSAESRGSEAQKPYIVMEYVPEALPITDHATSKNLDIRARLELFLQVCEAVHYAHRRGIIHRDLKPSNILVDGSGRVAVIDFGVARLTEGEQALTTRHTEIRQILGTLQYMSPEQCGADLFDIDIRSDVYSLGVVLYELLSGQLPYDVRSGALLEALRFVQEAEPRRPSSLRAELRGDLETLLLAALEKDRALRYQSASDLQADIRRYLSGDLLAARPASPLRRALRLARRHPQASIVLAMAALATTGFLGYQLLWFYPQVQAQHVRALEATKASIEAREEASAQAALAARRLEQVGRLSDSKTLADLRDAAEGLWPAYPERIPEFTAWLREAEELAGRLPLHRRTLEELREEAPVAASGPPEEPRSEQAAVRWETELLTKLVADLEAFAAEPSGLIHEVRGRLTFAERIAARSLEEHRAAWRLAVHSIADRNVCPQYQGLQIEPQCGLVPIGPDPQSGFWEFCLLQTGTLPDRDATGHIHLTDETGMILVLLPGGSFQMGCERPSAERPEGAPNVDPGARRIEGPIHAVTLKPFFISKYEMTQGQWKRTTGENPSYNNDSFGLEDVTPLHPVEHISWHDCVRVLPRLKLRLPTEAEWEYAARGGTTTVYWTGNDRRSTVGSGNFLDNRGAMRWVYSLNHDTWLDDGWIAHAPVGSFRANPFGLYDVQGNVYEWCRDSVGDYDITYRDGTAYESFEPTGKIIRSASYFQSSQYVRTGGRPASSPELRSGREGVRPAADLEGWDYGTP
ncbi:MAG: SUMF1/EgtB/PvdO family nonheme iron enzyme [Candidatus Eisenbacteria bacterium]|nr:SUMF1/EgtB/PvdO family nonheme iron enzyme [Candidatus Eisenbacteria bacterium]